MDGEYADDRKGVSPEEGGGGYAADKDANNRGLVDDGKTASEGSTGVQQSQEGVSSQPLVDASKEAADLDYSESEYGGIQDDYEDDYIMYDPYEDYFGEDDGSNDNPVLWEYDEYLDYDDYDFLYYVDGAYDWESDETIIDRRSIEGAQQSAEARGSEVGSEGWVDGNER